MADISPFCGLRYNLKTIKNIKDVFAPPYDIISEKEQKELYARHPFNVVRLILAKTTKKDDEKSNRYSRAGSLFKKWIKDGVLVNDEKPAIYIYTQDYTVEGVRKKRIGFLARMKFDEKGCLPHEHTLIKPKEDRLRLIRRVHANLSPIFSFYIDNKNAVGNILKSYLKKKPLISFTDAEKIRHCFWKVDEAAAIKKICGLMKNKQVFIADGHHRYEVSRNFRDELLSAGYPPDGDFNHVMMYLTGFNEDNLYVMPTHRLVKNVPELESKLEALKKYFSVTAVKSLSAMLTSQKKEKGFSLGMYYKGKFFVLTMQDARLLEKLMRKTPQQWRKLDVAMLNTVVFEHIFKLDEAQKEDNIGYTRDAQEAVYSVNKKHFDVAFFPNATKAEQVKTIALSGSRMPQKSTYFYPKPITGLVIHKF
ncbi:MAG: DUF1015 domain-containing protein [Candidatus Omnitrophica bacterium]|nr:DUF1015 domain-containing protein [Candidatus Omnitrophota bacterium]MBU4478772.1 DUF1015 domain-containing protein [Candidatus Omnitrophota bacterium]MCG2704175.1 DUF1015 domain-containing protein [Candidatus Omnitrophota bacterium]